MKKEARIERHVESLEALSKLLLDVVHNPSAFAEDGVLLAALNSQSGTAKYSCPDRGILGTSLNTLKRISDRYFKNGYDALEVLRKGALESHLREDRRHHRSNKKTKTGLAERVQELEQKNAQLREDLILLTSLLNESVRNARQYASSDPINAAICKKNERVLLDKLSLRSQRLIDIPFEQQNAQ